MLHTWFEFNWAFWATIDTHTHSKVNVHERGGEDRRLANKPNQSGTHLKSVRGAQFLTTLV